jgi:hypothetical protein
MRLTRLRLGDFRDGEDLALEFTQRPDADPALAFLVGPNGAGKSRVLESLGRIFSHLSVGIAPGLDFDLEYELEDRRVLITTKPPFPGKEKPSHSRIEEVGAWLLIDEGDFDGWQEEHLQDHWPTELDQVLPFRIIGLSTGPTSRLDWALRRSLQETLTQRIEPTVAPGAPGSISPEEWEANAASEREAVTRQLQQMQEQPRCVPLSGDELVLAVLALLSHPGATTGEDEVRDKLLGRAGLNARKSLFTFTFDIASDWRARLPTPQHGPFESLLGQASRRLALEGSSQLEGDQLSEPDQRAVFEVNPALNAWIADAAETPFIWFDQLLRWRDVGAIKTVRLVLKKKDEDGLLLDYDFSDGEFLLAGRYGLLLLLRDHDNCLVLFDEPETHFNDRWKVDLVIDLERILAGKEAQVMLATHSDLTVSDADRAEVHMLEPNSETGAIEVTRPVVSPFAADRDEITRHVFGASGGNGHRGIGYVDGALKSDSREELEAAIDRVGPGYNMFRLQYALRKLDDDVD